MSLYVVVEGRRTEPKIYRAWLPLLIPGLLPVARIEDAMDHHFYIVAGRGYPSYLDRIHAVFRERKQRYSKDDPGSAITESYLDALKDRASPPPRGLGHLASFAHLLELPRRYSREP